MAETPIKTRTQQHEVEIDAPAELVWKAISQAEEVTRWLCEEARITPGEGGSFAVSWGEGQAGDSVIEAWEPGRRLRIRLLGYAGKYDDKAAAQSPMYNEYTLETRGGKTLLRLVHSGIPEAPDWEGYYDGTNRGWQLFMLALRHYVEDHAGTPRDNIMIMRPLAGSLTDAWQKLTGPEGLGLPAPITGPGTLSEAVSTSNPPRYTAVTGQGDSISGEILMVMPPKTLLITIDPLGNALYTATFEEMAGNTYVYMTLATFALGAERFAEVRAHWSGWMEKLLPAGTIDKERED